jgi:hypothetical protein
MIEERNRKYQYVIFVAVVPVGQLGLDNATCETSTKSIVSEKTLAIPTLLIIVSYGTDTFAFGGALPATWTRAIGSAERGSRKKK